jgi:hypothetical protein
VFVFLRFHFVGGCLQRLLHRACRLVRQDRQQVPIGMILRLRDLTEIDDLNSNLLAEIEHFFVSYNAAKGKEFKIIARRGAERAREIVVGARRLVKRPHRRRTT